MVAYHGSDFDDERLAEHNIPITRFLNLGLANRIFKIRRFIRDFSPATVIAYLHCPSIPTRKFLMIVSERTGKVAPPTIRDRIRFQTHRLADAVVTNSNHLRNYIVEHANWLETKTTTIVNCVDLKRFDRSVVPDLTPNRIVVLARFHPLKNPLNVIRAVHILKSEGVSDFLINWYGNPFYQDGQHQGSFPVYGYR